MNLTDIMLFGGAVIGDGGSGGGTSGGTGSAAFHFYGSEEEMKAKYPVDAVAGELFGGRSLKVSDVGYTADELDGTIAMTYHEEEMPLVVNGMYYARCTSDGEPGVDLGALYAEGPIVMVLVGDNVTLLSIADDFEFEGITINKGLYLNLDWFMQLADNGSRKYNHVFFLIGT